jgi:molybdopterin-binding protein
MITTYKVTKVFVDKVFKIKVTDNTSQDPMENNEIVIRIETEEGNEVELILHASSAENLKLDTSNDPDWIKPKVYKGEEE